MNQFLKYFRKVSKNNTRTCWVLKCDIKKFFASIDHHILLQVLEQHIEDREVLWLLGQVVNSFSSISSTQHIYAMANMCRKGLPLGNLTSQLLVNIYMNEFDQFVKHKLKAKYYIRYADDFVFFSPNKSELTEFVRYIAHFLSKELKLELHPDKVFIKTLSSGVDFLGWVHFPTHRVFRTVTKRRMFRNLSKNQSKETIASYMGMLKWGDTHKLIKKVNSAL